MTDATHISRQLGAAVYQEPAGSVTGLQERFFAHLFTDLVYPQIWEDPVADMQALALAPGADIMCIASGGCNAMSYLVADPASVTAVDLSPAHVALLRLKVAAAQHLDQAAFFDLFGHADRPGNPDLILTRLAPVLDPETRAYWAGRSAGRVRAGMFSQGLYRQGILGRFIGAVHLLARVARVDFRPLLQAQSLQEQIAFHDGVIAPMFDKSLVRFLARRKASLFGLGIPPAQFDKLAADAEGDIVAVLRERVRRLVCAFPLQNNYFLWQAFHRGYAPGPDASLPPYLVSANFNAIASRADRLWVVNQSLTDHLAGRESESLDAYVLLDAQDWMNNSQLNALWSQITRTARPGARALFRTGGASDILPGRVSYDILCRWQRDAVTSQAAFTQDRSAIYGGVHLYRFQG